jgi:hypothetical protein
MFFLKLGFALVTYFTSPADNPYLIHGMLAGNDYKIIPQDPASGKPVVYRSNNQSGGAEFTWSIWLNATQMPADTNYRCVFVKGTDSYSVTGLATVNNGPGLYLYTKRNEQDGGNNTLNLHYVMDVVSPNNAIGQRNTQEVDIANLPIGKWFHVAIRLQNKTMDCYINGVITNRISFGDFIPKQNYDSIIYAGNSGFSGSASNLRYYDYAMSVFEINSVVYYGPNLNSAAGSSSSYFDYLGQSWYSGNVPN